MGIAQDLCEMEERIQKIFIGCSDCPATFREIEDFKIHYDLNHGPTMAERAVDRAWENLTWAT